MPDIHIADDGACLLGDQVLHPSQGAIQAAMAELAGILNSAGPRDTLVLAGSGLGWHAKAVLLKPSGPRLVVYETDAKRLALARSLGPDLTGALIAQTEEEITNILAEHLVYDKKPGRVAVYAPDAYRNADPGLEAQAKKIVRDVLSRSRIDFHTRASKHDEWLGNIGLNFKHVLECPDLTRMVNAFNGMPALVVGAGPSLDASLEILAGNSSKALLMGAASAIGPMAALGMAPQVAVALEAKDESRQFKAADPARTLLAAASSGHVNHFSLWPGKKALFHLQPWVAKLSGGGLGLPNGGHATSAAFSLAVLWGCDPIILVGQDLAYSGGRIHAANRPGGEDEERPDMVEIPAIGGGLTETSPVFMSYINWYQETAAYLAKRGRGPRVINATFEGAYLSGFEHMPLEEAMSQLPERGIAPDELQKIVDGVPFTPANEIVQNLTSARVEVRRCLAELERGGVQAAKAAAGKDSAAGAALEFVNSEADAQEAAKKLSEMSQSLRTMAEGMYA
jgi:hypothetical protein